MLLSVAQVRNPGLEVLANAGRLAAYEFLEVCFRSRAPSPLC